VAPLVAFAVRLAHGAPSAPGLGGALVTSLITATISTAIIALLGIPLAYLLARVRGRLATLVTVVVALPLALPPLMSGILLLYLVGPYTGLGGLFNGALTDSRAGIVLAQTFVAAPFLIVAARGAFAAVDPELDAVARTLGHRRTARFLKVAMPVAWPGVQAGLLLAWLRAFGEFGATVILAYHPYSLPVFTFVQFDSSGLSSTKLPIAAALGAAIIFVLLAMLGLRPRRKRRPSPPQLRAVSPPPRMPEPLRLSLRKQLGDFELALSHTADSPRLALLGPSGAGKTLTLQLLAGIATADDAHIFAGDRDLTSVAPEHRRIGYLPQHSALLPGRTVWQQVTFAVGADPALAAWWLERFDLHGLEDRLPAELSGGQRRRVALVRALARDPLLLLLDEPFSALDAPVRTRLSRELRRLQREQSLATVLVTHDPEEAALLADELIVIDAGRVLQQGPVGEVLARPASPQVAALLGVANTHGGAVEAPGVIRAGGLALAAPTGRMATGTAVSWSVRPEDIVLDGDGFPHRATVLDAIALGAQQELTVQLGELELSVRTVRPAAAIPGDEVGLELPADAITVWPASPPAAPRTPASSAPARGRRAAQA
jgi:ABC-type sulfate/molybdate transport systems ATPase subunit/ABC-type sulfate transport system permease component